FEVALDMLAAADARIVRGKLVSGIVGEDRLASKRRRVHAERAEQLDVPPAPDVLTDAALLIDRERQLELVSVQACFESDGPGAENGDARRRWRHGNPSLRRGVILGEFDAIVDIH